MHRMQRYPICMSKNKDSYHIMVFGLWNIAVTDGHVMGKILILLSEKREAVSPGGLSRGNTLPLSPAPGAASRRVGDRATHCLWEVVSQERYTSAFVLVGISKKQAQA